jgi:hypothetical protein
MNATAVLALVLPALLGKGIVHFAENDDSEEGIIFVRCEGTARQSSKVKTEERMRNIRRTHTADRGTTIGAKCS